MAQARSGSPMQPPTPMSCRALRCPQVKHPCILSHFADFTGLLRGKRLAVFLDYDGKRAA
eukprot:363738-Chlamydomonas_euryale.AAC.12